MVRHSSAKRVLGERSIAGSNPVPSAQKRADSSIGRAAVF